MSFAEESHLPALPRSGAKLAVQGQQTTFALASRLSGVSPSVGVYIETIRPDRQPEKGSERKRRNINKGNKTTMMAVRQGLESCSQSPVICRYTNRATVRGEARRDNSIENLHVVRIRQSNPRSHCAQVCSARDRQCRSIQSTVMRANVD